MTTVVVKPSKNKTEFSAIKIGTFFISASDLLYLKTDGEEAYSFQTECVIHYAKFNEVTVVEPEIILKNKEYRRSSNHTSGDSAFTLHDYTYIDYEYITKDESISLGDFYKFNGNELCLRISDNEYFSFTRCKKCVFVKENMMPNYCLVTNATININCSEY